VQSRARGSPNVLRPLANAKCPALASLHLVAVHLERIERISASHGIDGTVSQSTTVNAAFTEPNTPCDDVSPTSRRRSGSRNRVLKMISLKVAEPPPPIAFAEKGYCTRIYLLAGSVIA
jgi:hypothetical protein